MRIAAEALNGPDAGFEREAGAERVVLLLNLWGGMPECVFRLIPSCPLDGSREIKAMLSDEVHYRLMRLLQANPGMSQRDVARELGISLGKVNYCLRALIRRGWIKATNFKNSQNKAAYMYLLTPRGLEQKAGLTARFLQVKMREYEMLRAEIEEIRKDGLGRNSG